MIESQSNLRLSEWWAWAALAIGFSPVLLDWWVYAWAPDTRLLPVLIPLGLIFWARSISRRSDPRLALGAVLILIGLGLELLGILAETWTLARLGAPIGVIGMAMRLGSPSPRLLALLFFAVPIPTFIMQLTTPQLESFYASIVSNGLAQVLGLTSSGPLIIAHNQSLELTAPDAGMQTAALLIAGLWTLVLLRGWSFSRGILLGAALLLMVPPLQIGAVGVASLLLALGRPEWSTAWLRWGFYLSLFILSAVVFRGWRPHRTEAASQPHIPAP